MTDSFWKKAADSLPPEVRWRYAKLFEAAERYEQLFDLVADAGDRARRALAGNKDEGRRQKDDPRAARIRAVYK